MMNRNNKHNIISIEGNIGSGKSTLLGSLEKYYKNNPNVIFLQEPISKWNTIQDKEGKTILQKFYNDPKKYSFSFQFMALISFIENFKETIKNNPNSIIITERSLNTNKMVFAKMLFDSGDIEYIDYQIYTKWFDYFSQDISINKIIYMKTNPNKCMERIHKRARTGEELIKIDYLNLCDKYHEDMIFGDYYICNEQIILDGNIDIDNSENGDKQMNEWINMIDAFIKKN
jgi:deoxyguanosine kinase